ncbi:major facilitator superfamily domain-containing protein [Apiosordaria backusii]|uniref:Major facilitator superfamily domain-containing protein n=1 Tax=Apiosordaria backusii TaxID=314023 RepID=A0AA40BDP9_9PEZI|nr:major facilitator superfamily domain-containing protein [Apiosordaria backusii]
MAQQSPDEANQPPAQLDVATDHQRSAMPGGEVGRKGDEWKAGRQEWMILATLSIISFIIAVDVMILIPALPTLAHELGGTSAATFWTGTSFLLANAALVPFIGAISDIFGRRELLMVSLLFFTVGTVVCCTSYAMTQLLVGRTLQGVGAGGIQTMSYIIVSDIVPLRQRPKYGNFTLLAWGLGAISGPVLGGVIAEHTTWSWLFYINFPICGLGLLIVPLTVSLKPEKKRTFAESLAAVDWAGGILFIASISSFLVGLTWAGTQFPWNSYQTLVPIIVGIVGILLSVMYEIHVPALPFLRVSVFNSLSAVLVYVCTAVHGFLLFSHLFYIMFYYQSIKAINPTMVAVIMVAVNLVLFPASIVTGLMITRFGSFLWAIWGGLAVATLGNGLLFLLDQGRSVVATVFILLVSSIGQGLLLSALNVATQTTAKTVDVAYAVTMFMFMRTLGMCLGVALGGTTFQNVLLRALEERKVADALAIAVDAESFVARLHAMQNGPTKDAILESYVKGFHGVFSLLVGLSASCLLSSFFMKHHTLDKKLDSEHKLQGKHLPKGDSRA